MLVSASKKKHIKPAHLFVTRDSVRGDSGVRVPEVRTRVYVIDGSSDVILRFLGRHFLYFDLSFSDTDTNALKSILRWPVCGTALQPD
jgi:hypothetical protein